MLYFVLLKHIKKPRKCKSIFRYTPQLEVKNFFNTFHFLNAPKKSCLSEMGAFPPLD